MQETNAAGTYFPTMVIQSDEKPLIQGDKAAQIGPRVIQEMDSDEEIETVLGSEEKLQLLPPFDNADADLLNQIRINKKERKKRRKCKCIAKEATVCLAMCGTGIGLASLGCAIAACVAKSNVFATYFALTWVFGMAPNAFACVPSYFCWQHQERLAKKLGSDNDTLKLAIENIKEREYIAFIDSQQYENLEELLILPDFHRYVKVCIKLKNIWQTEKSEEKRPLSTNALEKQLMLRAKEEELANALFIKLDGHFNRFDIKKEE